VYLRFAFLYVTRLFLSTRFFQEKIANLNKSFLKGDLLSNKFSCLLKIGSSLHGVKK